MFLGNRRPRVCSQNMNGKKTKSEAICVSVLSSLFYLSSVEVSMKGRESSSVVIPTVPWVPRNVYVGDWLIPGSIRADT